MREHLRTNAGLLIAGIAIVVLGFGMDALWFPSGLRVASLCVINILPGLLLLTVWYLASAFPRRRRLFFGLGLPIALLGLAVAALLNWGLAAFEAETRPVYSVPRYEAVLEGLEYPSNRLVAHFPAHVPANATRVTFYYLPRYWQGPLILQLRCRLPPSEVDPVWQRYRATACQVHDSAGDIIEGRDCGAPLPTARFRNDDNSGDAPLPQGFLVLVLDADPCSTDPVDRNHGYSYGVAVSTGSQEVIYWAEYW
jgi:hypothetical protein